MKKILAVFLAVLMIGCVFAGCSDNSDKPESTTTLAENPEYATDKAVIKEAEAIDFIRNSYSEKELGLDKTDENYSLMIASTATDIDGKKYVNVVANVRQESDVTTDSGEKTYTFKIVGSYFISFDAKKVLKKDLDTGEYQELENRYKDFKKNNTTDSENNTTEKK